MDVRIGNAALNATVCLIFSISLTSWTSSVWNTYSCALEQDVKKISFPIFNCIAIAGWISFLASTALGDSLAGRMSDSISRTDYSSRYICRCLCYGGIAAFMTGIIGALFRCIVDKTKVSERNGGRSAT